MEVDIMLEDYTEKDRVAYISRKLYNEHYRDVRRPDRTRLWKSYTGLQGVLSVATRENSIPFFSKGRAKYVKEEHAKAFLDEYIKTRIHSNGNTRSPINERDLREPAVIKVGYIAKLLGIDKLLGLIRHQNDIQLRVLEQLNELNELWKPTTRSSDSNGSIAGDDTERAG
tara:strand:- start:41229 stop:41738 length:510 start_codon:yes stop_codon:yes gene_type:complete